MTSRKTKRRITPRDLLVEDPKLDADVRNEGDPENCDVCAGGRKLPARYHGLDCDKRKGRGR